MVVLSVLSALKDTFKPKFKLFNEFSKLSANEANLNLFSSSFLVREIEDSSFVNYIFSSIIIFEGKLTFKLFNFIFSHMERKTAPFIFSISFEMNIILTSSTSSSNILLEIKDFSSTSPSKGFKEDYSIPKVKLLINILFSYIKIMPFSLSLRENLR